MGGVRAPALIEARSPRKLAWILYGALEQRTGGTIYDRMVVSGLRALGDEVDVISLRRDIRSASPIVRHLARTRPGVVIGDELCFRELAEVFARCTFTRRVLLVHHLSCWEEELAAPLRAKARRAEAVALRHADHVIATSETTRARLVHEGHRRSPIDVVLPGSDRLPLVTSPEKTVTPPLARRTFLFVGAILARKRVHALVRALTAVPDATLRLLGSRAHEPAYVREVDALVAAHRLEGRVTFLGEVDEAALAQELAGADALVMPSSLEGYGIAATEAIHAGLPVIATRGAGLVEALRPCVGAALLFDDVADLARAMRDAPLEAMREAALRSRSAMPTWEQTIGGFRRALSP